MASKRQAIALTLLFLTAVFSSFAYSAVMSAVFTKDASVFVVPIVWFFLLLMVFVLGSVLWQETASRAIGSIVFLSPSIFFAPSLPHLGIIFLGSVITFVGLIRIEKEFAERTKVSIYRGVGVGFAQVIFALTLVVSSQYFHHVNSLTWDELVPSFDLAEGTGAFLLRTASALSPSLSALQDRNLSVDSFLQELKPVSVVGETSALEKGVSEALRQAEIFRSKTELSRLLGREVSGDENMNAVLSEVLRKKLIAFVSGRSEQSASTNPVPFLPFFLTILLFLTVYPLGALLGSLSLSFASLIFHFFIRSGLIVLKRVPVEREIIV